MSLHHRQLFGTDGVRGEANVYPMTGEVAMALGRAICHHFKQKLADGAAPLIIVGKDTRLSCYMIEQAISAGICSQGGRVILTGPLPTPGVAFVTQSMRATAGVMISASHNSFKDNGIKVFDSQGEKLPDEVELEIEDMTLNPEKLPILRGDALGRAKKINEIEGRYVVFVKAALNPSYDLEGLRLVLDCAHGASYKTAPLIFEELGAEIFPIGVNPNGTNINDGVGSLYPAPAQDAVVKYRADLGICLDGDADRIIVVDELGQVIPGDVLLSIFTQFLFDTKVIRPGDEIVGTQMSNLGLEEFATSLGLEFARTQVGDRYIIERMKSSKAKLGGEPSGHIIFSDYARTGDGSLAGLKLIECMKFYKKTASDLAKSHQLYPGKLINLAISEKRPFDKMPAVDKAKEEAMKMMDGKGRVLLRYSGTENLARVMTEGKCPEKVLKACEHIVEALKTEIG